MKFAWTSINDATPGGESNAAMNKRQTGRRRSGRTASVAPARATSREAAQGSLLTMAAGRPRRRWLRFDGVGLLRRLQSLLAALPPMRLVCAGGKS